MFSNEPESLSSLAVCRRVYARLNSDVMMRKCKWLTLNVVLNAGKEGVMIGIT